MSFGADDAQIDDAAGGPRLHFSDDRFLHRVLLEAQKNGNDAKSVSRLQDMGFGPEIAKVALHVCGGDERKALELCMSGLSFVDDTVLEKRAPPAPLRCYICGQKYLTHKSLDIHLKACRRRFELRESQRHPSERCRLLDESEVPEGESLEHHYEVMRGMTSLGKQSDAPDDEASYPAPQMASYPSKLMPCEHCKRTFHPDRLATHQRVCLQRPRLEHNERSEKVDRRPERRRVTLAGPPPAAVNSYTFRPDLLAAHQRSCSAVRRASPAVRPKSRSSVRHAVGPRSPSPSATPVFRPADRRKSSSSFRLKWTSPAMGKAASAVPGEAVPGRSDAEMVSTGLLLESKLIAEAKETDERRLRDELEERIPEAHILGIYRVLGGQANVYEALKSTMAQGAGPDQQRQQPEERDLWHGTAWSFVPKILKQGFNRSFAGRHGTLLGHATYFSSDPRYSMRFCGKKGGADGTKVLVVARVLVGRYCKGSPTDVEPPLLNSQGDRFDTTVDNAEAPSIFAVFRDFQALPLFLVEIVA
ncbi:Protein mono-ADP-ribosyltransferase PARP14 (ADP-ribosyltransferase diphtheria toxin-like 8) (ARTD8) (B aggressive lymphoma protein 2) (Poly [ADP-ribose] polymerase 14) (PARP-14) [Durusdinium trenchii]|uniref:Poly [ADP-ribose] polymerase n=1 Tax=Durusdinium trenchii TaxID=1381693 RepID=A0ABP0LBL0_9DINO